MADRTLEVQKALVAALKAAAGVSALVGARVYDRAPDGVTFPYLQVRHVATTPADAQGRRGSEALWTVDVWSRAPGAVECRRIMAAVHGALHWATPTLDAGSVVMCRENGRRDVADPDGVTTHGMLDFIIVTDG